MDVDRKQPGAVSFDVRGVPTVMRFNDGAVVSQKVGLPRKAELAALLNVGSS